MFKRVLTIALCLIMLGLLLPESSVEAATSVKMTTITFTKNGLKFKWKNSKKATGYVVYRSEDGEAFEYYDITNKKYYTDPYIETGSVYKYKVLPYQYKKRKYKYQTISNSTIGVIGIPRPVYSVVHHKYTDKYTVTWVKNVDASAYLIYRSTDKKTWECLDKVSYKKNTYEDKSIVSGKDYYYKVQEVQYVDGKEYFGLKSDVSTAYNDPVNIYKTNKININLNKIHPYLRNKLYASLKKCNEQGIYLIITEGYRTKKYQDSLYAKGRTKPGKIVTYAKGKSYSSQHQWGIAFDIAINGPTKIHYNVNLLAKAAKIIKTTGLGWGGDWTGFCDMPHFYLKTWGATPAKLKRKYKKPKKFKKYWYRTTKEKTKLYSTKDMSKSTVKATIPKGTKVAVLYYKSAGYSKVEYGKLNGFVYTKSFKKVN